MVVLQQYHFHCLHNHEKKFIYLKSYFQIGYIIQDNILIQMTNIWTGIQIPICLKSVSLFFGQPYNSSMFGS